MRGKNALGPVGSLPDASMVEKIGSPRPNAGEGLGVRGTSLRVN